jgi:hypothetical protein
MKKRCISNFHGKSKQCLNLNRNVLNKFSTIFIFPAPVELTTPLNEQILNRVIIVHIIKYFELIQSMSTSCWLAKQFDDLAIPVIYIRTKLDEGIEADKKTHPSTHNEQRCIQRIRKTALSSLTDNAIHTQFFYMIGGGKPLLYDFADLVTSMVDQLKPEKREAFTLSMIPINSAVISKKWEILNARIWVIACASAASGTTIAKCESKAEMDLILEEVRFYRKQLGAQVRLTFFKALKSP